MKKSGNLLLASKTVTSPVIHGQRQLDKRKKCFLLLVSRFFSGCRSCTITFLGGPWEQTYLFAGVWFCPFLGHSVAQNSRRPPQRRVRRCSSMLLGATITPALRMHRLPLSRKRETLFARSIAP